MEWTDELFSLPVVENWVCEGSWGGGGGVVMDKEVDLERQLSEKLRDERTEDVVKRRT